MIDLAAFTNAMAATLAAIPELVDQLALVDPIVAYIDTNPTLNSVAKAIYQMQPGQLLVVWRETNLLTENTMSRWDHRAEICVRAMPGASDLALINSIVNGVPQPGDGLPWRMCPIMDGVLPTNVMTILRETDTEGVDYCLVLTSTFETGDWPNP